MKSSDIPVFPSRRDVVTLAAQSFAGEDGEFIMGILDLYGVNQSEPHREFIQMSLVSFAKGDVDKLLSLVEKAKCGYQDCLYDEAIGWGAYLEAQSQGWSFTVRPLLPHDNPVSKKVAAQLLRVHPQRIDELVEDGMLRPLPKNHGGYQLFAMEELERFQRENEPEVNIAEIWQAQQTA